MKENQPSKKTFDDCIDIINLCIQKQRSRWRLDAINWFDFEDVQQHIKIHIYNKWSQWQQDKPLEPWLGKLIRNQIYNLIRNHYGNYVKPCLSCPFALGEDGCSATANKIQNSQCLDYSKWEKTKKVALDLRTSLSMEDHYHEVSSRASKDFSYERSTEKLNIEMKKVLSEQHYKAYYMLFFEKKTEEDVAKMMGYKTSEEKRKAGYRQIKNLKKLFLQKAAEIIKQKDIIIDDTFR